MTETVTPELIRKRVIKAREAISALRDATRQGIQLDHHKRDPLVMAAHAPLDDIEPILLALDAATAEQHKDERVFEAVVSRRHRMTQEPQR